MGIRDVKVFHGFGPTGDGCKYIRKNPGSILML